MLPALLFHSNHHYLAVVFAIMLLVLLVVFFLLWGWWELRQCVTLSPPETAKAFDVPMMRTIGRNSAVEGILKEIGGMEVKYNDEVMVNGLRDITQLVAEQGYGDKVPECGHEM
jgi:hypothetical protein